MKRLIVNLSVHYWVDLISWINHNEILWKKLGSKYYSRKKEFTLLLHITILFLLIGTDLKHDNLSDNSYLIVSHGIYILQLYLVLLYNSVLYFWKQLVKVIYSYFADVFLDHYHLKLSMLFYDNSYSLFIDILFT